MSKRKKNNPTGHYKVGYGKPPKHTQFKKGQSGNPEGRPPKRMTEVETLRDMRAILWRAATTPITTTVGGNKQKMPALEAVYLKLVARCMEGHTPSIRLAHTLARESMEEHEEWQATFYSHALKLMEQLKDSSGDERNDIETDEIFQLLDALRAAVDKKITDTS